jgi:hypothetical protein
MLPLQSGAWEAPRPRRLAAMCRRKREFRIYYWQTAGWMDYKVCGEYKVTDDRPIERLSLKTDEMWFWKVCLFSRDLLGWEEKL